MITYIKDISITLIVLGIFAAGIHMGRNEVRIKWDIERAKIAANALLKEREYASQLSRAQAQASTARIELDRLRAMPVPRILCHQAPAPVSRLPAPTQDGTASHGELPPVVEFDPTDALFAEADRADELVEDCRTALTVWPK